MTATNLNLLTQLLEVANQIVTLATIKVGDRLYVPYLQSHGTVRRIADSQIDIMMDNKQYIQTSVRNVQKNNILPGRSWGGEVSVDDGGEVFYDAPYIMKRPPNSL